MSNLLKPEDNTPNYRTFMYNKVDNEIQSVIVNMDEAKELYDKGWKLSPAEFHEELGTDTQFQLIANDVASKMNQIINIDSIDDKHKLIELGQFYGIKLSTRNSLKQMKFKLKEVSQVEDLI